MSATRAGLDAGGAERRRRKTGSQAARDLETSTLGPQDRWVITLVVALLLAAIAGFALSAPGLNETHAQALVGDQQSDTETKPPAALAGEPNRTNQP